MGKGLHGAEDVMQEEFFKGMDWDGLYKRQISPPFVPCISSTRDTQNFDPEFTNMETRITPVQSRKC
jgi:hypothetical protein